VRSIIEAPRTDYTRALFAATPRYDRPAEALLPIPAGVTDTLWAEAAEYDQAWWASRPVDRATPRAGAARGTP
jgi:peptide/nickel transport system ATP-binding protein